MRSAAERIGPIRFTPASPIRAMDRQEHAQQNVHAGVVNRGDLFWIAADESRGSIPGHPHPHLVVQDDVFNHSRISTVVVCALSTNMNRASEPGNVLLDPGEGGLSRQSVVVVSQVSSLYKTRLGERIGALSDARVEQVLAGLRFLQSAFFHPRNRTPGGQA